MSVTYLDQLSTETSPLSSDKLLGVRGAGVGSERLYNVGDFASAESVASLKNESGMLDPALFPNYASDLFELVSLGTTPLENAESVRAAYNRAKQSAPGGNGLDYDNAFTILLPPGFYLFSAPLVLDTPGIRLMGLVKNTVYFEAATAEMPCILDISTGNSSRIELSNILFGQSSYVGQGMSQPTSDQDGEGNPIFFQFGIRVNNSDMEVGGYLVLDNIVGSIGCPPSVVDEITYQIDIFRADHCRLYMGGQLLSMIDGDETTGGFYDCYLSIVGMESGSSLGYCKSCIIDITGNSTYTDNYRLDHCRILDASGLPAHNGTTRIRNSCF